MFDATNDVVHLDCKDQAEQTISSAQLNSHTSRNISALLPIPTVSTTSKVYVSSGALQFKAVDANYFYFFLIGPGIHSVNPIN